MTAFEMTAEQALQNVEVICRQFSGYTLGTAAAVEQPLKVLREAIKPKEDAGRTKELAGAIPNGCEI